MNGLNALRTLVLLAVITVSSCGTKEANTPTTNTTQVATTITDEERETFLADSLAKSQEIAEQKATIFDADSGAVGVEDKAEKSVATAKPVAKVETAAETVAKLAAAKEAKRQKAIQELAAFIVKQVESGKPDFDVIRDKLQAQVDAGVLTEDQAWELGEMTNEHFKKQTASIEFSRRIIAMAQPKQK